MKVVLVVAMACLSAVGAPVPKDEELRLFNYGWNFPSEFSDARIERLLSLVTKAIQNTGYRHLGVEEDFFHGHVLFEERGFGEDRALVPRAILYHTQESAHAAHWGEGVDKKYDYVDVTTRNWIQWFSDDPTTDGTVIENARDYLDSTKKDPTPLFLVAPPQHGEKYTIHSKNLDPERLGFTLYGEFQFDFRREDCAAVSAEEHQARIGGECFRLKTPSYLIETASWYRPQ